MWVSRVNLFLLLVSCWLSFNVLATESKQPVQPAVPESFDIGVDHVKVLESAGSKLYLGTSDGFYILDTLTNDALLLDYDNGLISKSIHSVIQDPDGETLWLGTYGGGLVKLVMKEGVPKTEIYNVRHGLNDSFVYDVEFDKAGDMWIGTWSGANKVSGDINKRANWTKYTVENTNKGLSDDWVYAVEIDSKQRKWFGTEVGISLFDGEKWKKWDHNDGLGAGIDIVRKDVHDVKTALRGDHHETQIAAQTAKGANYNYNPNYVVSMELGPKENLWVGTWGGGLSLFDVETETFTNYTTRDGLPSNFVLALEFDKNGVLWIGTIKGLASFDGKTIKQHYQYEGLLSRFVYSMTFAENGSFWVGGRKGITRIPVTAHE